jgi:hypothetical protein
MTATTRQQHQQSRGQDCWGRNAGTGQLGQNSQDMIARTGYPGQDRQRRQEGTGPLRPDCRDRSAWMGELGQDCQDVRGVEKGVWTEQLKQDYRLPLLSRFHKKGTKTDRQHGSQAYQAAKAGGHGSWAWLVGMAGGHVKQTERCTENVLHC